MTTTKAQFAADASHQLAYILSALGLQDDLGASEALRAALQGRGSLKVSAKALADTLRTIKLAVRVMATEEDKRDGQTIARLKDQAKTKRRAAKVAADDAQRARERIRAQAKEDTDTEDFLADLAERTFSIPPDDNNDTAKEA
jgi:hypothetical protein